MNVIQELQTQAEILARIKAIMRDSSNNRWTNVEIYEALNQSLSKWVGRVSVPSVYTIPDGWQSNVYAYALPHYIRGHIDVQQKAYTGVQVGDITVDPENGAFTWVDVPAWEVEPDGSGGEVLRLGALPYSVDGRVIFWAANGPVPTTVPTTSAAITDVAATSLTLTGVPMIGASGFIKIDQEWMSYAGYTQSATITTLQNLVRGLNGTTAATHLITTACYWGVAAFRADLFSQLNDQIRAFLFALFLTDASPLEKEHHTFQMRFWQQSADEYWRRFVPNRPAKFRHSRQSLGGRR
ncbi:MAG: hypothetical protein IPL32_18270 [Chloracidobacterium sp.]|nr:hypothetical protein [Chloracidobacterium sp.]